MEKSRWMSRIFTVMTVLWMCVIFWFSAQPADRSTDMSEEVGYKVAMLLVPGFSSWTEERQMALVEQIDHPVRKCAHATEYAILSGLLLLTFTSYGVKGRKVLIWALAGTALYACTDEFHQIFVEGRAGMVTDVLIDTCGGGVACLMGLGIMKLRGQIS